MSAPAIYEGTVAHERRGSRQRNFTFRIAMPLIDLEDLEGMASLAPLWRAERSAPMSFRRADYMGASTTPLVTSVRDLVEQREGFRPDGPIHLLALHRTWGWVFNPIALYYCYGLDGETLQAVVADVTNTPWGERHAYVIDTRAGLDQLAEQTKALHVSPFLPMGLSYRFTVSVPGPRCDFAVTVLDGAEIVFRAQLRLRRLAMTRQTVGEVLVRRALLTQRVTMAIYLHAARLWLGRTRVFPHPRPRP